MVWHYNAFLSYEAEPVVEERVWLDADTANLQQVELNAYLIKNRALQDDPSKEKMKSAEFRYAVALASWTDEDRKDPSMDQRG